MVQPEERKFYWSNLPASASLETLVDDAHRRHAIEQFHEAAKEELGWDQYQGRLWPGFHRHAVTVMLAMSFLTRLEWQHLHSCPNRGRPRDPFPPRPDWCRCTLPAVHRQVAWWLRHQAVLWWITTEPFRELCSLRI